MIDPPVGEGLLAFADDVLREESPRPAARVAADYMPSKEPSVEAVRDRVEQARTALALLTNLSGDRVHDNYLALLLGGPRLALRRAG